MDAVELFSKRTNPSLGQAIKILATDRSHLQEELKYAKSTIAQLEAHIEELGQLLYESRAQVNSIMPLVPKTKLKSKVDLLPKPKSIPSTTWLRGHWLSSAVNEPFLVPIEAAWQEGHGQEALNLLSPLVARQDLHTSQWVDASLLLSAIIRSSSRDARRALGYVERALSVAHSERLYDLVGKAQFHQGLCYFHLERYADARWCFVLAAYARGHEEQIDIHMKIAEQKISELPPNHAGRKLSLSHDVSCQSCIDDLESTSKALAQS